MYVEEETQKYWILSKLKHLTAFSFNLSTFTWGFEFVTSLVAADKYLLYTVAG